MNPRRTTAARAGSRLGRRPAHTAAAARLRVAVADLPRESAASAAAVAGFADQAHFTRTARSLLGRTPASIGRSPA
ncbi:helix-turn-helix domain-containing protein [Streptomyces sp. NPDC002589]|uniref:helix-turn-helix domain-containing protein n=1 Tax=Streptomyces sp. NPDC002589 TaxID=3154420 RepID=UPI0033208E8E